MSIAFRPTDVYDAVAIKAAAGKGGFSSSPAKFLQALTGANIAPDKLSRDLALLSVFPYKVVKVDPVTGDPLYAQGARTKEDATKVAAQSEFIGKKINKSNLQFRTLKGQFKSVGSFTSGDTVITQTMATSKTLAARGDIVKFNLFGI